MTAPTPHLSFASSGANFFVKNDFAFLLARPVQHDISSRGVANSPTTMRNRLSQKNSSTSEKRRVRRTCPFLTQRTDFRILHLCGNRQFIRFCFTEPEVCAVYKDVLLSTPPSRWFICFHLNRLLLCSDVDGVDGRALLQMVHTSASAHMKRTAALLPMLKQTICYCTMEQIAECLILLCRNRLFLY